MSGSMPVRMRQRVSTPAGAELFSELVAYCDDFTYHCSCPANGTCEVCLQESAYDVFDLIVTRPHSVIIPPDDWLAFPDGSRTRYEKYFIRPSCVDLTSALADLLTRPLRISGRQGA